MFAWGGTRGHGRSTAFVSRAAAIALSSAGHKAMQKDRLLPTSHSRTCSAAETASRTAAASWRRWRRAWLGPRVLGWVAVGVADKPFPRGQPVSSERRCLGLAAAAGAEGAQPAPPPGPRAMPSTQSTGKELGCFDPSILLVGQT